MTATVLAQPLSDPQMSESAFTLGVGWNVRIFRSPHTEEVLRDFDETFEMYWRSDSPENPDGYWDGNHPEFVSELFTEAKLDIFKRSRKLASGVCANCACVDSDTRRKEVRKGVRKAHCAGMKRRYEPILSISGNASQSKRVRQRSHGLAKSLVVQSLAVSSDGTQKTRLRQWLEDRIQTRLDQNNPAPDVLSDALGRAIERPCDPHKARDIFEYACIFDEVLEAFCSVINGDEGESRDPTAMDPLFLDFLDIIRADTWDTVLAEVAEHPWSLLWVGRHYKWVRKGIGAAMKNIAFSLRVIRDWAGKVLSPDRGRSLALSTVWALLAAGDWDLAWRDAKTELRIRCLLEQSRTYLTFS